MNGSESPKSSGPVALSGVWRFALAMAILLMLGMVLSHKITVLETFYWIASDAEIRQPDGSWAEGHVLEIGTTEGIQEFRISVPIGEDSFWQEPVGLNLAGPFSAEIFWDGVLIGRKGEVGKDRDSEVPGTIDSISLIPAHLLEPGTHELMVRMSTHHAAEQQARLVHILALSPFRHDDRRLLRYYAIPILLLSGLLILIVQSLRIGFSTGNRLYAGLGMFGFFILVSLLAEVSRALINYPYDKHEVRGIVMWLSPILASLTLNYIGYSLHPHRWVKYALAGGFIACVATGLVGLGGDYQIALNFLALAATPALVQLWFFTRREITFFSTLPIFWCACVLSFLWSIGVFLDSYIFIASIIYLASAWFWVYVEKPLPVEDSAPGRLVVKSKGKEIYIPAGDVVFLRAEGNFTMVVRADGSEVLHQLPLGKIMDQPPPGIIRVHRSYAVNRDRIKALRSAEGSKYWLEMEGADDVPVSRYRVSEIRPILAE